MLERIPVRISASRFYGYYSNHHLIKEQAQLTRRVVVTGIGLVCAVGIGTEESWKNLLAGHSGVATITSFDSAGFECRIAGEVKNFDPFQWIEKRELKKMGRFIQLTLAGADFAVKMADWKLEQSDLDEVGVYVSSGIGGFDIIEREHIKLIQGGPGKISPFFIPSAIVNLASGYISIRYGARGPNSATACSASAHAIGDSFKIIERGAAEMMICGGTEAAITPMGVGGFASMKALSTRNDDPPHASRPFDAQRDGFVVGEGAGILILESLEHAQRRNAPIFAEIVGYGMSGDACHITQPAENGDGAYRVMHAALKDAKLAPKDIGYVNARGTSTPIGDVIETRALKRLFWGAGEASSGEFDEVDDRAFARWRRWTRSRHQRAGATRSDLAPDDQSRSARSGVRPGLRSECGAQGVCGLCSIEFVWVWRYKRCAHFQTMDWQIADSASYRFVLIGLFCRL
jgi:3-oxoacyl-[acyl-carrier-protein] synthase II